MSEENLSEELAALEAALSSLGPKPSGLDRDRVMFLAGRASVGKRWLAAKHPGASWLWPCLTAASLLVAAAFGGMLLMRGGPPIAHMASPTGPGQDEPTAVAGSGERPTRRKVRTDYLRLRQLVLAEGVDALPAPGPSFAPHGPVPTWGLGSPSNLGKRLGG
jgi:hypothetical protein